MGNQIYAQMSIGTILLYSPLGNEEIERIFEVNNKRIKRNQHGLAHPIYELSVDLFKLLIDENKNNDMCNSKIAFLAVQDSHRDWIKSFEGTKIQFVLAENHPELSEKVIPIKFSEPFYNFIEKSSPSNFQKKCDLSLKNFKVELPVEYLSLQLSNHVKIYRIKDGSKTLIYQSGLDEKFHFSIIVELLRKENPEMLYQTRNQLIGNIIENGNHQSADLLVGDIFGVNNCAFIGLPPKLIAASLGKVTSSNIQFSIWDQLKSIIAAFAVHLALQIKKQMLVTNVYFTLVKANEFYHPSFLHLVEGLPSFFGQVWFDQHGLLHDFTVQLAHAKLISIKQ